MVLQQSAKIQHASHGATEKRIVSACNRKNSTDYAGGVQISCDAKRIPPSTTLKNTLTRREARHWVGRWVTSEINGRSRPALSVYIYLAPQRVRLQPAHVNCKTLPWPTGFAARLTNKGAIWEMHARCLSNKALPMEWLRAIAGDMRCGSLCRWSDRGIGICHGGVPGIRSWLGV